MDIEKYGRQKQDWLETFLELPNGIPSHDTLDRVFGMLDPVQFQQCFADWVQSVVLASEGRLINIDGKSLRGSRNAKGGKQAIARLSQRKGRQASHSFGQCLGARMPPDVGPSRDVGQEQ